jgi:hypothetical protein
MIKIERVMPLELDDLDKLDLIKFAKYDYNKRSAAEMVENALREIFQIWRVSEGEHRALLITKVIGTARGGKTLYVEGLVGMHAGFTSRPKELVELLFELARTGGCSSVTGWVQRPGMIKWLEEAGLPLVASVFMKEVPNVPQSPA